jgi:hypothetical protein
MWGGECENRRPIKGVGGVVRCVTRTSVWNLLSHRYSDVLMGLKGSKSMFTRFSFPSSVKMVPQYSTRPLSGILLYSFNFCCVDVIAPSTDNLQTNEWKRECV